MSFCRGCCGSPMRSNRSHSILRSPWICMPLLLPKGTSYRLGHTLGCKVAVVLTHDNSRKIIVRRAGPFFFVSIECQLSVFSQQTAWKNEYRLPLSHSLAPRALQRCCSLSGPPLARCSVCATWVSRENEKRSTPCLSFLYWLAW